MSLLGVYLPGRKTQIGLAVGPASRHLEEPTKEDVIAVKRVLRYVKELINRLYKVEFKRVAPCLAEF